MINYSTSSASKPLRIGIDCRFWKEQGHGRYVRNLVTELQAVDRRNEYIIFLLQKDFDSVSFLASNFTKVVADVRWYTFAEQTRLLKIYNEQNLDLLHVPHFNVPLLYRKPFIVTIHDLTITHFASLRSTTLPWFLWKIKRFGYHLVLWVAITRARKILTVSNFVKQEILKNYGNIPETKVSVTLEAVEQEFMARAVVLRNEDTFIAKTKARHGITKQYLLYVGNAHPHKNIERLLRVFSQVQAKLEGNIQLVIVGKEDFFLERVKAEAKAQNLEQNVIFTGFVPDDELVALLKGAAAFVFPSLAEGFGIPPLEAMAVGTPVIASNATSLPEVCGDAAYYINPTDEDDMARKIMDVLTQAELRLTLMQNGYERVKAFSWQRLANETLREYEHAVGK